MLQMQMNVSFGDAECLLNGNECNWSLCGVLTWKVGVAGSLFVPSTHAPHNFPFHFLHSGGIVLQHLGMAFEGDPTHSSFSGCLSMQMIDWGSGFTGVSVITRDGDQGDKMNGLCPICHQSLSVGGRGRA